MLKKVLLVVGVIVVGLFVVIAMQPNEYSVERSAVFSASPEAAFAQVNDFHKWDQWSPWAKLDPTMKSTYSGPEAGVGASIAWVGNSAAGEGKMEILESKPGEYVKINLEFIKPFAGISTTHFRFAKEGEGTKVTWRMEGKNSMMGKAFSLVMNMDKRIGADFDKGLAQMKVVSETAHAQALAQAQKKAADEAAAAQVAAPTP